VGRSAEGNTAAYHRSNAQATGQTSHSTHGGVADGRVSRVERLTDACMCARSAGGRVCRGAGRCAPLTKRTGPRQSSLARGERSIRAATLQRREPLSSQSAKTGWRRALTWERRPGRFTANWRWGLWGPLTQPAWAGHRAATVGTPCHQRAETGRPANRARAGAAPPFHRSQGERAGAVQLPRGRPARRPEPQA